MISIVPLEPRHCPAVARLHLDHLPTGFRGRPGSRLLEVYYAALALSQGGCGFVAEGDEQVVGYVCGVWAHDVVRAALMKASWPTLVFWGTAQVLLQPRLFKRFVGRSAGSSYGSVPAEVGYQLRPIVVAPAARGGGIGAQLVGALLADATRRGFDRVHLFAEEDNVAASAFYCKLGFRLVGKAKGPGEAYLRYEYSFSGS